LALQPDDYPIAVESDGTMAFSEGGASYAGQFRMESLAAAETLEEQPFVVHVEDAPPPLTYRIVGAFRLDHRMFDLHEFRLETGERDDPYHAEGSAHVAFGPQARFMVRAEGQQVRLGPEVAASAPPISFERRL